MASSINNFARRLATNAGLNALQTDALVALATRLAGVNIIESRRLIRTYMDDAALAELGIDDPLVAALARQTATARSMELEGASLDEVTNADPHASARSMITQLTEAGDKDTANRLKAGLDEVLAAEKEETP